ncbi:peptidylprolyl isomerase [bacterium]|nr:peptidylprolyl isomerase [bacterium]
MKTRILIRCQPGDIIVELDEGKAPKTCANFIAYMQAGAYEETSFFRIVTPQHNMDDPERQIAVIQGGPKFNLKGHDPNLSLFHLDHEPTTETGISHNDGTISMGRFAPGETYGGFFFCIGKQPALDYGGARFPDKLGAAAFGKVAEGLDILYQIYNKADSSEFLANEIPIFTVVPLNN